MTEDLLLGWSVLFMPAVLLTFSVVLAVAIYLTHSIRIRLRYRSRIVPVDASQEKHEVLDYIRCVSERIGLVHPPSVRFLSEGIGEGMAFGLKGNEYLFLNGAPPFWKRSPTSEAIVLHELAHVKNHDAQDREWVKAIWISVLVILALTAPLAVFELGQTHPVTGGETPAPLPKGFLAFWLLQLALLVFTIWWIWAGLLRARELYADWRVASWGMKEPLTKILNLEEARAPWWPGSWAPFRKIWRAWQLHPSHETRQAALNDASRLFKVTPDLPLTTGFLVPALIFNLLPLLNFVIVGITQGYVRMRIAVSRAFGSLPPTTELKTGLLIEALFLVVIFATLSMLFFSISYLTTKALGIQIQKEAVADLASGVHSRWGYTKLLWPSFLFAVGVELALTLAPMYTALVSLHSVTHFLPNNLFEVLATAAWIACFTLLVWLWMVYVRALCRFTLGNHAGTARPCKASRKIAWSSTVLLTALSWPAIIVRFLISMASSQVPYLNDGPTGYSDVAVYYKYTLTPLAVVALSLAFYLLWAGVSLLVCCHRLLTRRPRCPSCNEISEFKMIVGRRCDLCDRSPALWTHADVQTGLSR